MTANQIAYNQLLEQGRANRQRERQTDYSNQSGRMQATAALEQAKSAAKNADTNLLNAQTNMSNAEINARNADTNARNAQVNEQNALTNRIEANLKKAKASFENALTAAQTEKEKNLAQKVLEEIVNLQSTTRKQDSETALNNIKSALESANVLLKQFEVAKNKNRNADFLAGIEDGGAILDALIPNIISIGKIK